MGVDQLLGLPRRIPVMDHDHARMDEIIERPSQRLLSAFLRKKNLLRFPRAAARRARGEFTEVGAAWAALVAGARGMLYAHGPETGQHAYAGQTGVAPQAESRCGAGRNNKPSFTHPL